MASQWVSTGPLSAREAVACLPPSACATKGSIWAGYMQLTVALRSAAQVDSGRLVTECRQSCPGSRLVMGTSGNAPLGNEPRGNVAMGRGEEVGP